MQPRSPLVVILAGPNGAGKTTSAATLLRGAMAVEEFVNADTIAAGLSAYHPESTAVAAGRIMLDRLHHLAGRGRDLAFETTLAGTWHVRLVSELRAAGYAAHLVYLSLPTPELAIARVRERTRRGGHFVPDATVPRRYRAGLRNLIDVYPSIVDRWRVYENAGAGAPTLVATGGVDEPAVIADQPAWQRLLEQR